MPDQPTPLQLVHDLLVFFSLSAAEQSNLLDEYQCGLAASGETPPHVQHPFADLAEGFEKLLPSIEKEFPVSPQTLECVRKIVVLVNAAFLQSISTHCTPEAIAAEAMWKEVRVLSSRGLQKLPRPGLSAPMGVFDLLCYVAD